MINFNGQWEKVWTCVYMCIDFMCVFGACRVCIVYRETVIHSY